MNKYLKNAAVAYKETAVKDTRVIEIPELVDDDGNILQIYVRPASLRVRNNLVKYHEVGIVELMVATIIIRSEDEDGKRIFKDSDTKVFMDNIDADVVARIATEINADMNEEDPKAQFVEAEKN